jgi:hypothetical protein
MAQHDSRSIDLKDYVDLRIDQTEQSITQDTALLISKIDSLGTQMDSFETRMDDRFQSFEARIDDKINILTQHFNWKFYMTLAFCIPVYLKLFAPEIMAFINS